MRVGEAIGTCASRLPALEVGTKHVTLGIFLAPARLAHRLCANLNTPTTTSISQGTTNHSVTRYAFPHTLERTIDC
jgi:hypothetical protein